MSNLGKWTVIDIETTGIDPVYDKIIDIGFLEFDGIKLVRKYSSLVQFEGELGQFIQKLTGITTQMAHKAPRWEEVSPEVLSLYGQTLVAHNAEFEKSFLCPEFDEVDDGSKRERYVDSIYYLALIFPEYSSLKLENFIVDFSLADKEVHRGFQDSLDLLKVLLVATIYAKKDKQINMFLYDLFQRYTLEDFWFHKLFFQNETDLYSLANEIEFDLESAYQNLILKKKKEINEEENLIPRVSFEFSGENIKSIFQDENAMGEIFPGYKFRESQMNLALKIGQSFKNKVHSLVQAPTGTGKSLANLLTASLFTMKEGKQVLLSTGTKALQQQAMDKDIPQLRKILGVGEDRLKIRRLIGSSNHLCELLFRQSLNEDATLFESKFGEIFPKMYFESLFEYNARALNTERLTKDDLPYAFQIKFEEFRSIKQDLSVDFRACTGFQCPHKSECSYFTGLQEAKDAHIVIGNHALMFNWTRSFPRPQHIIVDEAHKIEEEVTRSIAREFNKENFEFFFKSLQNSQGVGALYYLISNLFEDDEVASKKITEIKDETTQTYKLLEDHVQILDDLVERYFKKMVRRYSDLYWNELPMIDKNKMNDSLAVSIYNHFDSVKNILEHLQEVLSPYSVMWDPKDFEDENLSTAWAKFESFAGHLEELVDPLKISLERKDGFSHAIKYREGMGYLIHSAPIDVGKILHDGLLQTSESVVYTSATLGNGNGDSGARGIEWATGYSYLKPERRFKAGLYLPAIYDYKEKTKVFLCDDVPPMYSNDFVEKSLEPILKVISNIGGRTLLLFSAKIRFEIAREILLERFEGKIPVFVQGMGSKVVEEFKNSENGILLGMESFGEGIDIPGESLQFVFIDKIPDLRKDLVIDERQDFYEANLGNSFHDYYLAHRTRSLHQKLGRLLRTESDYGGVIIVDSRIKKWKGRTMDSLMKLMEPYDVIRGDLNDACKDVEQFILEGPTH